VQLQSNTSFTGIPKGKQGVKEQSGFLSAIGKSEVQQDKGLQKQELKHADDMFSSLEVSPLKSSEQVMGSEKNAGISVEMEILHLSNKRTTQSVDIPAPTGMWMRVFTLLLADSSFSFEGSVPCSFCKIAQWCESLMIFGQLSPQVCFKDLLSKLREKQQATCKFFVLFCE
jgi:hypothetical protein